MGHVIEYHEFDENVSKKYIQMELDNRATYCSDCGGDLGQNIRFNDSACLKSREEAEEWLKSHDKGWYDQLAVKYCEGQPFKASKKLLELKIKASQSYKEYDTAANKLHFADTKSESVSCKYCKSRITKKFLKTNYCPVCGTDLRPASTLERIDRLKQKSNSLNKQYKQLEETERKKVGAGKTYWLVKIEYHV